MRAGAQPCRDSLPPLPLGESEKADGRVLEGEVRFKVRRGVSEVTGAVSLPPGELTAAHRGPASVARDCGPLSRWTKWGNNGRGSPLRSCSWEVGAGG